MKNTVLLPASITVSITRWSIWMILFLLILRVNDLKAVNSLTDNDPVIAYTNPCDIAGSETYNEKLLAFKNLSLKEKRQIIRGKRHIMKDYKSKCPEQYKLFRQQKSIIFWTDAWHVGLAIILFPIALFVAVFALLIYLYLEFLVEGES